MEKRVVFGHRVLPYLLVLPQMAITLVFFLWPASQAIYQSALIEDAFGLSSEFVWFENYAVLLADPLYLGSFRTTAVFSIAVSALSIGLALFLAVMADRVIRGAMAYKTLLLWPLRRRAGSRGRALAVHVQPLDRAGQLLPQADGL